MSYGLRNIFVVSYFTFSQVFFIKKGRRWLVLVDIWRGLEALFFINSGAAPGNRHEIAG